MHQDRRVAQRLASTPPVIAGLTYERPLGAAGFADVFLYRQELPLGHRLILHPGAEFDGVTTEAVMARVVIEVPPPIGYAA